MLVISKAAIENSFFKREDPFKKAQNYNLNVVGIYIEGT